MAKDTVRSWDTVASNNTDIAGIGIQGSNAVSNFDGALRTVMKQIADVDEGVEPMNDTFTLCDPADSTKRVRIDAGTVAAGQTRVLTMPNFDVTLGTAATQNTGTSGATLPFLNGANTFSEQQKIHVLSGLTGAGYKAFLDVNIQEAYTSGTNFHITSAVVGEKLTGATGHRTAFYVTQGSSVSEAGKFIVGIQGTAIARSGSSGSFFGLNGYSQILSGTLTTAECVGGEYNTSVRNASVLRKVGLQIADVDGSTGAGTTFDACLMFLRSADSIGWNAGIHFSNNSGAGFPIKSTGKILRADTGTVLSGIDLSSLTITDKAFHSNQFFVDGTGKLQALGVYARAGSAGTVRANVFNVDWDGAIARLYIDSTSLGQIISTTATSATATAGAATLPANPLGFYTTTINGTSVKVPYYNP